MYVVLGFLNTLHPLGRRANLNLLNFYIKIIFQDKKIDSGHMDIINTNYSMYSMLFVGIKSHEVLF